MIRERIFAKYVVSFLDDEAGETSIEYSLIVSLVAIAIVGSLSALGASVSGTMQNVSEAIAGAPQPGPAGDAPGGGGAGLAGGG